MAAEPHEDPAFTNAAEFTVTITYVVAGGARRATAQDRARRVAERLANAAARIPGVVEATARAGPSHDGKTVFSSPVPFAAANTGQPTGSGMLDRYVDPDRAWAQQTLAEANRLARDRREDDQRRRREVGCRASPLSPPSVCGCVYCRPSLHAAGVDDLERMRAEGGAPSPGEWLCVCGVHVPLLGQRCLAHRATRVVVLDGDPPELARLAAHDAARFDADRDRGLGR